MPCHTRMKLTYLQGLLWLYTLQLGFMAVSLEPGFLDFDNLPDTNFTCVGRVVGGYYADTATSCQMFHVCTLGQNNETMDIRFLCLNGTVFEQATRVCERIDEVDCEKSEQYYHLNNELYGGMDPLIIRGESNNAKPPTTPSTTTTTTSTTTPKPTSINPYYATIQQTTLRQKISPHYTSDSSADIRFDPKIINLQLNSDPSLGANIKPVSYQQQRYDDENHHTVVTTHSYKNVVPKTIYGNFKEQNLKPSDINYEFEYHDQDQYNPEKEKTYHIGNIQNYSPSAADLEDYTDDIYKGSTYRTLYRTTSNKRVAQDDSSTYKAPLTFSSSSNPQVQYSFERTEVPIKQQVTPPPSIFSALSSPAPFAHPHHMETKRNTDHHKIKKSFSLSISDQNGKELVKVNNTPISDIFPGSYLDYNDDDVTLIPVFEDVPKLHKRRHKRNTEKHEVLKADPEATDVLRFLLNWYTNYEKTTKISVPLTSQNIQEINDELSSKDNKNETNSFEEQKDYGNESDANVSELRKRENDYYDDYVYEIDDLDYDDKSNVSNIIVSTKELDSVNKTLDEEIVESKKNAASSVNVKESKNESNKNYTHNYIDEYVDDNYEPLTYNNNSEKITDLNKTELDINELAADITTVTPNGLYDYVDDNYEGSIQMNSSDSVRNISDVSNDLRKEYVSLSTDTNTIPTDTKTTTVYSTTEYSESVTPFTDVSNVYNLNTETFEAQEQIINDTQNTTPGYINNTNVQTEIQGDEIDNITDNYKNLEPYSSTVFDMTSSITTSEVSLETTTEALSILSTEESIVSADITSTTSATTTPNQTEVPISTEPETTEPVSETTYLTDTLSSTIPSKTVSMITENLDDMIKDIEIETKSIATTIVMPQPKTSLQPIVPNVEDSVTEYLDITTQSIATTSEPSITTTYIPTSITTPKLIKTSTRSNLTRGQSRYSLQKPTSSSRRESTHRFNLQQRRRYDRRKDSSNPIEKEKVINDSVNNVNTERLNISKSNFITTSRTINRNIENESVYNTEIPIKEDSKYFPTLQKTLEETITDPSLTKSANPTLAKGTKDFLATTPISRHIRIKFRKEKINKKYMFTCFNKKINKFYSDPRDCRLFHYCSQGYTSNQLVDMKFVCDLGTYFDDIKLICTEDKPVRCL